MRLVLTYCLPGADKLIGKLIGGDRNDSVLYFYVSLPEERSILANMKHALFVMLLLLSFAGVRPMQAGDMHFRHYNNKNGLSHNTVYCSLQDTRGFMWFGTDDGLNRFDGYTFKVYRYNSHLPGSLPDNRINSLFEDSEGRIWICTNGSTCYYDYRTDTFAPLRLLSEKLPTEQFQDVKEDGRHHLWFIEYNRIVEFSAAKQLVRVYPAGEYFHPVAVAITERGEPLLADAHNLYLYKQESGHFDRTALPEVKARAATISAICEIPNVGVLVGTDRAGLLLSAYRDGAATTLIADIQVRAITPFSATSYWIASETGIHIYNALTGEVEQLRKSLTNEFTISGNAVYSLCRDREGGMWVCTFFGGISYLPKEYIHFSYFIAGKTHPDMLGNAVREICPDRYGHIWLGTEDNGINRYNPQSGEIVNFSLHNPTRPLSATNIHGLLADGSRLWVGTFNKGIDVLDIPSGKIVRRYTEENTNRALNSNFVLCFYRTRGGDFLVGTSSGIASYNEQADTFRAWEEIHALVRQIYEDTAGNIWVATASGVYRYPSGGGRVVHYTAGSAKSQTIGSNNTTSVFEDSKGRIWVTTSNGLSLYNNRTDSFLRITVENGLSSNIVYRLLEENDTTFWISTANGLVKFNPDTYVMRTFTYTDGLPENQFNYSSSYKAPDGTMYMGTINGMIAFTPEQFREDMFCPPIYITRLNAVASGKKSKDLFAAPSAGEANGLQLRYDESTFTLSYVALSFTAPQAIRYAYKLEGIDKDWNYMNASREVTFANLAPGSYLFRVKSTNSSGVWQANEKTLPILITPPFYATGWAMLVYAVLGGLLVWRFYTYKKAKLEAKHRVNREKFENRKEKELYDAKIQFFTFITHEIRTPLTLIKAPLEKILGSGDGTPATRRNLHTIGKNTQRLLDLSNQLLDFRKTESRGFKLNFVKTDIVLWLETILQPFRPELEEGGKNFQADIPSAHFLASIDREAFAKIVSNLLTNAIKYSDKEIRLRLCPPEGTVRQFAVAVGNDGALIADNERENIFTPFYRLKEDENKQGSGIGLSLARSLAEFHKGTLAYEQTADGMNLFTLLLPEEQEDCYHSVTSDEQEEQPVPAPPAEQSKPAVLIVEDQADMRRFIAGELSEPYLVLEAGNGREALEMLSANSVSLIISDVMMPLMDGFELCNRVKNDVCYSHIPFLLLTAQHNLQSRLEGLNQGADAYMEKPFSIDLLLAQVQNLLRSREMLSKAYQEKPLTPTASLSVSPVDDLFLKKLNAYLSENLTDEALSVETLAVEMSMSASSLYRKVKGLSGVTPNDFIKITRLKSAVQLMQEGERRINEIAFRVGFSSPAYFATCFQKQYGKTPTEFIAADDFPPKAKNRTVEKKTTVSKSAPDRSAERLE